MSQTSILIVEDEAIVAADLANKLEHLGYAVAASTHTGEDAVRLATESRPSLVLMDIRLAGAMDGIEAAAEIRRELDIPVVFLTAHAEQATLARAGEVDAFGYVLKPYQLRELNTQIAMALYKHASERRLRESEERLRLAAEATGFGTYDFDVRQRQLVWSPTLYAIAGLPETTEVDRELFLQLVHPDERTTVAGHMEEFIRTDRRGPHELEYRILRPDGQTRWVRDMGRTYFEKQGDQTTAVRTIGTVQDVTERKRGEQQLKALNEHLEQRVAERTAEVEERAEKLAEQQRLVQTMLESTADGVIVADRQGNILILNQAGWQILGLKPMKQVPWEDLSQHFTTYLPDCVTPYPSEQMPLKRALRGEEVRWAELLLQTDHRPEGVWLSFSASPLRSQDGEVTGAVSIFRDISELKRLQQQIADEADREQERLGQELHDGVGQLLSGLGMMVSSLHDNLTEEGSPHVALTERVEKAVDQVKQSLRSISKGFLPLGEDRGGLVLALSELARQTEATFGLTCSCETDTETVHLNAYTASHLYRIAQEGLHNAVKHSRAKRIVLRLQTAAGLRLSIEDDGIGMDQEKPAHEGLGLRIIQYRAGLIGANCTILSVPRKGTQIVVTMPGYQPITR
jgi:PAS domain S-box-containing protein